MSTTRLAVRGVLFNWSGRACAVAITFVVTPIVIHGLGNEAYGVWSMVMSLGVYYTWANLGLQGAGVKYISQFHALDDRESVNKVVVTTLAMYVPLAAVVLAVAACVALALPAFIETEHVGARTIGWVIVVTGLSVSVGIMGQVGAALLGAFKRFDLINVVGVVAQVVQAVMIITVIQVGGGLFAMASVVLLVMTLRQLCAFKLAIRTAACLSLSARFFEWSMLRTLLAFGGRNLVVGFARRVNKYGAALIIGVILGPVLVTFYAIAQALVIRLGDVGKGINSVLMPVVSQLDAQNRRSDLVDVFIMASRTLLAITISMSTVFIALGRPLIAMWIGPEYSSWSYPVLCLLAVAMVIRMPCTSAEEVLKGIGRMDRLVAIVTVETLLTLTVGVVLVPLVGILGMGYAMLVSATFVAVVLLPVTCRSIGVSLGQYVWKAGVPGVMAALPGVAVAFGMSLFPPPSHLIHVVLWSLVVFLATGGAMFFVCFDKQLRSRILRHVVPERLSSSHAPVDHPSKGGNGKGTSRMTRGTELDKCSIQTQPNEYRT